MSEIRLTTLSNGLRILTDTVPSVHSVALGVWCAVGTRHENMAHNGAAHMVEHMLFKGTPTRSAQDIANSIETVGGHMNAYTSREITSYHVHLLREHGPLALEILADMYKNPLMPESEVERERHVILQEIGMCNDTPDDLIYDNFYETAYPEQAVGAPILGKAHLIEVMQRDTLVGHVQKFYTPARTVVSAAGRIDHDEFVAQVSELFSGLREESQPFTETPARYTGGESRLERDLEQSHIIFGFRGIGRRDNDYYNAQALSTILGGGMASRLFQEIREKRGLVYSIYSFHLGMADEGQFGIYAGTGPSDLEELVPLVCEEILKSITTITEKEVERAIALLKSNVLMGRESMMTRADQQAKAMLYHNDVLRVEEMIRRIEAVSVDSVQRVAHKIFTAPLTLASLGPLEKLEDYNRICARLEV